ncbi:MAG: glycoside hydrolase family 57 protein [Candidatus Omnitrophota bacterium]
MPNFVKVGIIKRHYNSMLNLAFIFHMHQPYYKNLLTQESGLPWVRLHGTKDYLDMVKILEKYPGIQQTFNLVPSLVEQIEDYGQGKVKDKFLELSRKENVDLNAQEKNFIKDNFFMINRSKVIDMHPRYLELYYMKQAGKDFQLKDYLDLVVWFNLSWIDPIFRDSDPGLQKIIQKARFFNEDDKNHVLDAHLKILNSIIPCYKQFVDKGQVEVTVSPYYHPILPLLYNNRIAREANNKTVLPKELFAYPSDAKAQIDMAVEFYHARFGDSLTGMWPSEEAVSEHILPFIIESEVKWIVTDEAILFKSLKAKKRDTRLLYQPYILKREEGELNIIFRDRNLSDMLGFIYHTWKANDAVTDFMRHLENINSAFKKEDILVVIAMDGENAWEYYANDGHDFLNLLYQRLMETDFVKTTTLKKYFENNPKAKKRNIKRLAAGSWIYGEFGKWIGNPHKVKAWEWLAAARKEIKKLEDEGKVIPDLAWKQMYILEGSDWFWWYGDNEASFDYLYRMHLENFYKLIGKAVPEYLHHPLVA